MIDNKDRLILLNCSSRIHEMATAPSGDLVAQLLDITQVLLNLAEIVDSRRDAEMVQGTQTGL